VKIILNMHKMILHSINKPFANPSFIMNTKRISAFRSLNQQISNHKFKTARDIASWMGALQAQDYNMVKWAFGIRLPDATEISINEEIDSGKIIRTHLLRPTWHFVSSDDIYWIQKISADHIRSSLSYRDNQLGLTSRILSKTSSAIENILKNNIHLTREELFTELVNSGLKLKNEQASHIFVRAETEGIICSGRQKKGKPTFALLHEWVPVNKKNYTRDESLKELGYKYFMSRGPATVQDFAWWSGLSLREARLGLEYNKSNLISEVVENQTFWFSDYSVNNDQNQERVFLLPSYDEFLLSYRDRSASISDNNHKKAVSNNGIFYPVILSDNQISGTWKRKSKRDNVAISTSLFKTKLPPESIESAINRYSGFLGKKAELAVD
jgi:hypothetical protein